MATPASSSAPVAGHRRYKSASVFRSIMVSKHQKRAPSSDASELNKNQPILPPPHLPPAAFNTPLLPHDHPHSQLRGTTQTGGIPANPPPPRKPRDVGSSPKKSLHKKTVSSVSLRSLAKKEEKPVGKKSMDVRRPREDDVLEAKAKKTKSSTNLAAMFGKGRSRDKQSPVKEPRDKENTSPPSTSNAVMPTRTPIWAEFSSQPVHEVTTTSRVPLNDQRRSIEEEIALYTPQDYSPTKQRNFCDYGQPSLQSRPVNKERPKSMVVPKSTATTSLLESFTRKKSVERVPLGDTKGNEGRFKEVHSSQNTQTRPIFGRASTDMSRKDQRACPNSQPEVAAKKPNRVMAAVAAFNGKAKQAGASTSPTKLDPKTVDAEFEEVLESRNIPTHQRAQMRTLKLEVKADFVRMHKLDTPQGSRAPSAQSSIGENVKPTPKPAATRSSKSQDCPAEEECVTSQGDNASSTKRERPRSRTFTFSRNDSPTKKQKGDANERKASSKSNYIPTSPSTRSLVSNSSDRSVSNGVKAVKPDEFINYLRKTPKPQNVEIGKLHKLRLLLRNETVDWVDAFIQEGGMTELVGLLHRIMEIEWREDHEDNLLHELLRCLKGLCTTATALKQLKDISSTLYPALLAMLFDEEHKGPSEFTTRELIIEIIFAHISMAPESELEERAGQLLQYLKDPVKEKESSTVPFIMQMRQPRPYQIWCKEMSNVTKEVFWIFIHNLNVIPIPPSAPRDGVTKSYAKTHFPGQRAIVPAAPYVGGVEWEATNYLATHIDLLNGLIASLPTREARNTLRQECKVSGFEKLMGHLRTCNAKYYGAVHDSVKVWIGAALEDDWDIKPVRMGPGEGKSAASSPVKMSPQKKAEKAPQIQAPKFDLGLVFDKEIGVGGGNKDDDWI